LKNTKKQMEVGKAAKKQVRASLEVKSKKVSGGGGKSRESQSEKKK